MRSSVSVVLSPTVRSTGTSLLISTSTVTLRPRRTRRLLRRLRLPAPRKSVPVPSNPASLVRAGMLRLLLLPPLSPLPVLPAGRLTVVTGLPAPPPLPVVRPGLRLRTPRLPPSGKNFYPVVRANVRRNVWREGGPKIYPLACHPSPCSANISKDEKKKREKNSRKPNFFNLFFSLPTFLWYAATNHLLYLQPAVTSCLWCIGEELFVND